LLLTAAIGSVNFFTPLAYGNASMTAGSISSRGQRAKAQKGLVYVDLLPSSSTDGAMLFSFWFNSLWPAPGLPAHLAVRLAPRVCGAYFQ
jgi:hypothetical protein